MWLASCLVEFQQGINLGGLDMLGMFAVAGVKADGSWDVIERFHDRQDAEECANSRGCHGYWVLVRLDGRWENIDDYE